MGVDPHVVGHIQGSNVDYGTPLHVQHDFDAMEHPQYGMDNLWRFKWGSDNAAIFDTSLEYLGDRLLMAEVHHFWEAGRIIVQIKVDINSWRPVSGRQDVYRMQVFAALKVLT